MDPEELPQVKADHPQGIGGEGGQPAATGRSFFKQPSDGVAKYESRRGEFEQVSRNEPRRWLLITREMVIATEEDEASHWSRDHLFFAQDARAHSGRHQSPH